MPIIRTVEPEEATGELAEIYRNVKAQRGRIGNNAKLFSCSPELLRQQLDFIRYYAAHPTLSMPLLAALRILVSAGESCDFCVDYNTAMLINMAGWTPDQVAAMRGNVDDAPLEPAERALLKTAVKAIRNAHGVTADDLDALRETGWSDTDIFDAVSHGARMLATDILFNAFKIEKES